MYSVVIPCRNGSKTIAETLKSLLDQTLQPNQIIVIDDASSDETPQILASFSASYEDKITVIRLEHNYPRNFNRVPRLVNIGLSKLKDCHYIMLSGDDSCYPKHYVETLLQHLQENPKLKITSGNIEELNKPSQAPQGSGRIIDYSWLRKHLPFPASSTWESGILFKALAEGMEIKCFNDLTFSHKKEYSAYSLRTFGHAMHSLGYVPLLAFGRVFQNLMHCDVKRRYVFYELLGYVEYCLASPEQKHEVRKCVRQQQWQRIFSIIKGRIGVEILDYVRAKYPKVKVIFNRRMRRKLNLASKPDFLSIAVTWKCNSRCSTCGIWNAPHSNEEMTLQDYERLLRDPLLSDLKVWEMTGGEPTLYKHISELTELAFKYLPHAEIRLGVNCVNPDRLIKLLDEFKHKPLYLSLSIDGIGNLHDQIRGVKGNFKSVIKVINHIRMLQKEGSPVQFGASVCVSKLNLLHIPELVDWLEQKNIPFQLTPVIFPNYARIKYARENRETLDFLSDEDRAKAVEVFSQYKKDTYKLFCLYWGKKKYPIPHCYALRKYLHITPDGDCETCMWKSTVVGNLRRNTLSEIWSSSETKKIRKLVRNCQECAYIHPNLCDALNNYFFDGTLELRLAKKLLKKMLRKWLWRF